MDVQIEAVLDPMCPWCYIGLRRLKRALASSSVRATVSFVPYVFDPETPADPVLSWREYVRLRYPSRAEELERFKMPLTIREAASEGLAFKDYAERPLSPTEPALRLLRAGMDAGRALEVVEALLRIHFEEGFDVSRAAVLLRVAAEAGVAEAAAREALREDGEAAAWVAREDERAKRVLRVSGVPHYILRASGGRTATLSGAVQPAAWLSAFASLASR